MIDGQRLVAVEEHVATTAHLAATHELAIASGEETEVSLMRALEGEHALGPALTDLDDRWARLQSGETDFAVLSVNPPALQPYDAADAVPLAREANDAMAEAVRRHPERFGGLGTLAPQAPERAAEEIRRVMGPLGLNGLMINSHTHGQYLDEPRFEPLLAAAEESGATIYLHPRFPSPATMGPYNSHGMAGAVWGFQAEAGLHATRMILGGVFDRHPRLRVVLGHLGEGLLFWLRRLDNRYAWTWDNAGETLGMTRLELAPSDYVRRNLAVTTSGIEDPRVLEFSLEAIGADNILFAIDTPYEEAAPAVEILRHAALDDTTLAKIAHGNAERLFRLPVAAVA